MENRLSPPVMVACVDALPFTRDINYRFNRRTLRCLMA